MPFAQPSLWFQAKTTVYWYSCWCRVFSHNSTVCDDWEGERERETKCCLDEKTLQYQAFISSGSCSPCRLPSTEHSRCTGGILEAWKGPRWFFPGRRWTSRLAPPTPNLHMHTAVPQIITADKMSKSMMVFKMGCFGQRLSKSPWSGAMLFSIPPLQPALQWQMMTAAPTPRFSHRMC